MFRSPSRLARLTTLLVSATMVLLLPPAVQAAAPDAPPATAKPALSGIWGGDGFSLRVIKGGAMVQGKCANGKITAPITLDAAGQFVASGYFNAATSGYRLSDLSPRDKPARFSGRVKDNTLELVLQSEIFAKPQTYRLQRGKTVKFTRCA